MTDNERLFSEIQDLDTSEISDAMDSLGIECALIDIKHLTGEKMFGPAFTVQYEDMQFSGTFQSPGDYIDEVPSGHIVVIDNQGKTDCTVWGDILTEHAVLRRIEGVVVNGAIRDRNKIMSSKLSVFAKGYFMRSGKNRVKKITHGRTLNIHGVAVSPGDYLFGDENGVVVIPKDLVFEVMSRAQNIAKRESLILAAIQNGSSLAEARKKYRYDQPWLALEVS